MAWTTPRTWVAGEIVTSAMMNTHVRDNFNAIGASWTSWTPTWTAISTNPTIGNGTLTGAYSQAGKLCSFRINMQAGSTTNFGSGQWGFSLPFTPSNTQRWTFPVDLQAGSYTGVASWLSSVSALRLRCPGTTAGGADRVVTSTVPSTWASTDNLFISGTYETA